jgi:hypothetical protein
LLRLVDELGDGRTTPAAAQAIVAAVGRLLDLARFSLEVGETAPSLSDSQQLASLHADDEATPEG